MAFTGINSQQPFVVAGMRSFVYRVVSVPAYPALLLLLVVSLFLQPKALTFPFLMLVLRQAAPLGLLALGQRMPIIGRSLDLSVGGQIALINVLLATGAIAGGPAWLSIAIPVAIGIGAGLLNAMLIVKLRASAVIVTLGTSIAFVGISLVITGGAPGGEVNDFVRWLARTRIWNVPVAGICWIVCALILGLFVRHTVFYRTLEALGSSFPSARLTGLRVDAALVAAHVIAGLLAALSGILLTGYIGTGTLNLGADLVLASVAAVILGGTTFGGGNGGVVGAFAGVLVLIYLGNLLTSLGIPEPFKLVVQGLVVVCAAALAARRT